VNPRLLPADVQQAIARLDPAAFRCQLVEGRFCEGHDIRDVSLVPLVISQEELETVVQAVEEVLSSGGSRDG